MKRWLRGMALLLAMVALLPLQARAAEGLIPVGQVIGLQLYNDRVTVAAYDDALGGAARTAGLKIGDQIVEINGKAVSCAEDVRTALKDSRGPLTLTVSRSGKQRQLTLEPASTREGPKMGVYLRQGIAGIGTVTFYDPETGLFGALGHGVCDSSGLMAMTRGCAYAASVEEVKKGKSGDPGQLKGTAESPVPFAPLLRNTARGVFGTSSRGWTGKALPIAAYDQIHTGEAAILAQTGSGEAQEYSVEILKIYPESRSDGRNFLLRVTDPALLSATGGIVQGMSGSPILQDGKLIGAVTHVLVNDPQRGYGIFIENMLEAAQ